MLISFTARIVFLTNELIVKMVTVNLLIQEIIYLILLGYSTLKETNTIGSGG
jgi:hypothetical protein